MREGERGAAGASPFVGRDYIEQRRGGRTLVEVKAGGRGQPSYGEERQADEQARRLIEGAKGGDGVQQVRRADGDDHGRSGQKEAQAAREHARAGKAAA